MNTVLLITILLMVVVPAAVAVYRSERRTDHISRVPLVGGEIDRRRIDDELAVLRLRRRDCA
ncbi:hypothetical protein AAFP35_18765 [Gordonia sp. CPCC 206044]|uniref:hypothetical protein n=1 Tax=Gordonia sp. CPCC 206044 TaxID=3140793 RepID=UPI003AF3E262